LTYDYYGEDGVSLIRRIQAQRRDQKNRKDAEVEVEDDDSDDDDDSIEASLYERVERLLAANKKVQAKYELQRFMEQNDYHDQLTEDNQIHLSCDMEFPPVVDLKKVFYQGRDYLKFYQNNLLRSPRLAGDQEYLKQKIQEEQRLVDYQINKLRDSQKASVGFSLSCNTGGNRVQPKWSVVMGANTGLIYPDVAKVVTLAGKKEEEQKHPALTCINMVYQPIPNSQMFITTNLSNDQSHQVSTLLTVAHQHVIEAFLHFQTSLSLDRHTPSPIDRL
jgi:hypothetical protein